MSDKAFTDTFSYLASEDEIKSLYRTLNARFNFAFKDGYLKCKPGETFFSEQPYNGESRQEDCG